MVLFPFVFPDLTALNALESRKATIASLFCGPGGLTLTVISEGETRNRRIYWLLYKKLLCLVLLIWLITKLEASVSSCKKQDQGVSQWFWNFGMY